MTDEMKLLRAFIEASGFDVESKSTTSRRQVFGGELMSTPREMSNKLIGDLGGNQWLVTTTHDYKVTKRAFNAKPTLHKVIREYEQGLICVNVMMAKIELLESDNDTTN